MYNVRQNCFRMCSPSRWFLICVEFAAGRVGFALRSRRVRVPVEHGANPIGTASAMLPYVGLCLQLCNIVRKNRYGLQVPVTMRTDSEKLVAKRVG